MKRIVIFLLLLSFIAFITVAAAAQGPGPMGMGPGGPGPGMEMGPHHGPFGTWWKNSDVVKELQLKQIEETFVDYRLKLIDLRADLEKQETRLQPLLDADQPNEQQVSSQVDVVLAARAKLEKTSTMMMLAIRRVLSVEQWKKLRAIEHRRGERNVFYRRMGPGEHKERFRIRTGDGPPDTPPAPPAPPDKSE
jgi:Spy/CpxP family protein refolding chaperone